MPDISHRAQHMPPAWIDRLMSRFRELQAAGRQVWNLGQAVTNFPPPAEIAELVGAFLSGPDSVHGYTADLGLPALRQAIREHLAASDRLGEGMEVVVTAGANQAFSLLTAALWDAGHRVGLLSPYFCNHGMAIVGSGGHCVEILPDASFRYAEAAVERAVREHQLRALVVCHPSNPTGQALSADEQAMLESVCERHDLWLISDEIYAAFAPRDGSWKSFSTLATAPRRCVTLGSLSKSHGIPGWRLGWLLAPAWLVPALVGIQDYSLICAPHASQRLGLALLEAAPDPVAARLDELAARREALAAPLRAAGLQVLGGQAAYFLWCQLPEGIQGDQFVPDLLEAAGVCAMPGSMFGPSWGGWMRLSFGGLDASQLAVAGERVVGQLAR